MVNRWAPGCGCCAICDANASRKLWANTDPDAIKANVRVKTNVSKWLQGSPGFADTMGKFHPASIGWINNAINKLVLRYKINNYIGFLGFNPYPPGTEIPDTTNGYLGYSNIPDDGYDASFRLKDEYTDSVYVPTVGIAEPELNPNAFHVPMRNITSYNPPGIDITPEYIASYIHCLNEYPIVANSGGSYPYIVTPHPLKRPEPETAARVSSFISLPFTSYWMDKTQSETGLNYFSNTGWSSGGSIDLANTFTWGGIHSSVGRMVISTIYRKQYRFGKLRVASVCRMQLLGILSRMMEFQSATGDYAINTCTSPLGNTATLDKYKIPSGHRILAPLHIYIHVQTVHGKSNFPLTSAPDSEIYNPLGPYPVDDTWRLLLGEQRVSGLGGVGAANLFPSSLDPLSWASSYRYGYVNLTTGPSETTKHFWGTGMSDFSFSNSTLGGDVLHSLLSDVFNPPLPISVSFGKYKP